MKSKKYHNQGREFIFTVMGGVFAVILLLVLIFTIRGIVLEANEAFGPPERAGNSAIQFNFEGYERLIGDLPSE